MNRSVKVSEDVSKMLAEIGKKLRRIRKDNKLTLKALAEKVAMSPSLINQVEKGVVHPSLETLVKISHTFGVPPSYFFDSDHLERKEDIIPAIINPDERKTVLTKGGIEFSLLSRGINLGGEFMLIHYPPHSSTGESKYIHDGIECGFVIEGVLDVEIGNAIYSVGAGSSITYRSSTPHRTMNQTSNRVTAIWVNTEPFIFIAK